MNDLQRAGFNNKFPCLEAIVLTQSRTCLALIETRFGFGTECEVCRLYLDSFRAAHDLESFYARPRPIESFAQFGKRAHFVPFDRAD